MPWQVTQTTWCPTRSKGSPVINTKEAALDYADQGWEVFPLHTPTANGGCSCGTACGKRAGKHPRTPNGLHDATTDPTTIDHWWSKWPDANIGIRTGPGSGV